VNLAIEVRGESYLNRCNW